MVNREMEKGQNSSAVKNHLKTGLVFESLRLTNKEKGSRELGGGLSDELKVLC